MKLSGVVIQSFVGLGTLCLYNYNNSFFCKTICVCECDGDFVSECVIEIMSVCDCWKLV